MVAKPTKSKKEKVEIPKYCIVSTFMENTEIPVMDYVYSKIDNVLYLNFVDQYGRIGRMKDEHVGITLINQPTKEDMDAFFKFKAKSEEQSKKMKDKLPEDPNELYR